MNKDKTKKKTKSLLNKRSKHFLAYGVGIVQYFEI